LTLALALVGCFVFAGTETAITAMGELRVRKILETGRGPDGWLRLWLTDPSRVLTTLLAGNTLASVAASSVTTSLMLSLSDHYQWGRSTTDWLVALAVTGLGAIILIAGEIAPKTLAKMHPEWFLPLMHVVWWFHLLTGWLTRGMIWFAMHIVRALGGTTHGNPMEVTEEQIEDMVRIGSEAGSIEEDQGDMLQAVFNLKQRAVRAIMTPRTQMMALPIDATLEQVVTEVQSSRYSRYPVYDKTPDRIAGVFFAKDLLHLNSESNLKPFQLFEHIHEPIFLPDGIKASDALKAFQKKSVHMAIVVDEHGGTAGVLTLEDVIEELVGDIRDEYDDPEPEIEQVSASTWTLEAATELRELAEKVGVDFPESSTATTVGGFVIEQIGRVPENGATVAWNNLTFEVLEADETHVVKIGVRRHSASDGKVAS
jgi:CBS domain containing-hemolysin-like protein